MKSTTRVFAAVAAAAVALGTVATIAAPAQAAKKIKIAFVMGAINDPFFNAMKVGATAEAKAQGVDLLWKGDAEYSAATQLPVVKNVIATLGKGDGLVLIPTDGAALQASNDQAAKKGIVVANVDTQVANLSKVLIQITGDNADGGAKAAAAIANAIGYKAGSKYDVVIGLTSATATTNVAGWLTKFPNLKGIFAIDGTNASGAAAALQAKNLVGKIALVGYDAYPANVALIKSGVFTALIAQDPAAEARLAVKTIVANIKNGTKPAKKQVVIPNVALTSATSAADLAKYTYKTN
jgi:ABC-type sugar transport system substrate-binding protein